MKRLTFFSVLKSNLKCAICKNKDCPVRYLPNTKRIYFYTGTKYVEECSKDKEKRLKQIGKRTNWRK